MLKQIFLGAYFWLLAPLYQRLQRDLVLEHQLFVKEFLRFEEELTVKVINELVSVINELMATIHAGENKSANERAANNWDQPATVELQFNDSEIGTIIANLQSTRDVFTVARQHQLSISELLHLQNKYAGMNGAAIRTLRKLKEENTQLKQLLVEGLLNPEPDDSLVNKVEMRKEHDN